MTISEDRVEDELGRHRVVFYVSEDPDGKEWIDVAAEDVVFPRKKR